MPSVHAAEDLRQVFVIGAAMGSEQGQEYIEYLQELAWFYEDAKVVEKGADFLRKADAKRGQMKPEPPHA